MTSLHTKTAASTATSRLQSLTSQITATVPTSNTSASPTKMPPITCHVLDTASGKPASNVPVTLLLLSPSVSSLSPSSAQQEKQAIATATTNTDGRVPNWSEDFSIQDGQVYQLRFDTWEYFKGETFFPYVEVTFVVNTAKDGRDHYHVPVLLAPWSYSTYRGS